MKLSGLEKVSKGHVKAVNNVDHVKSWKCSLACSFFTLMFCFFVLFFCILSFTKKSCICVTRIQDVTSKKKWDNNHLPLWSQAFMLEVRRNDFVSMVFQIHVGFFFLFELSSALLALLMPQLEGSSQLQCKAF